MKLYEQLIEQLNSMSQEELDKIWEELEPYSHIGPSVDKYINSMKEIKKTTIERFKEYLTSVSEDQLKHDWEIITEYPELSYEELIKPEYIQIICENNKSILKTYLKLLETYV